MGTASTAEAAPNSGGRQATPLVKVEAIDKQFGGVQALKNVSFELHKGEVLGLIGPNGSGKSTCVNVLSGTLKPTAGRVLLEGHDVSNAPIDDIVARGMIRTYQATQTFPEFTARQNVLMGCHSRFTTSPLTDIVRSPSARREHDRMVAEADRVLDIVGLKDRGDVLVSTLPAADQRLVMIAVAIAASPKVILLDEPAAGMVAGERKELARIIRSLPDLGISVLVIEHHMALIMEICDRIVVLNFGQKIADGAPAEIRNDPVVIEAYLGRRDAEHH